MKSLSMVALLGSVLVFLFSVMSIDFDYPRETNHAYGTLVGLSLCSILIWLITLSLLMKGGRK